MYSTTWKRPIGVEFPQIWKTFERLTKTGETLKFEIQDMSQDHYENAFSIMEKSFLCEETFHKTSGFLNPSGHATFIRGLVERIMLPQRLSLVCVLKLDDHQDKASKTKSDNNKVVGYNFLAIAKNSEKINIKEWEAHETGRKFLKILLEVRRRNVNLMEKYKTNEYLGSLGMCVHPDYRGFKIAEEILKARFVLCKAVGVKLTYSTFTASVSQKIAEKCGFVEENCIAYAEIEKFLPFQFITKQTHCKVMSYYLQQ